MEAAGSTVAGHAPAASADIGTGQRGGEITQAGERRVVSVESLRALCALGVVTAHIWITAHPGAPQFGSYAERAIAGFGFGALIFFALSGCLLYLPFAKRDFGGGTELSLRRYALNRFVRIMPLYYVALVVVLLLQEDGGTLRQWVTFGLFGENFFHDTAGQVNGVLWTLVVELHFFLILPLLAYVIARVSGGSIRRAAIILVGLVLISAAWFAIGVLENRPWRDPLRFSLINYFFMIGAGMLVALVRQRWDERPGWLRGNLARADVWVLAGVPFFAIFVSDYRLQPLFAFAGFLWLGAVVLPLEPGALSRLLNWRPLAILGLASYSIYMWQGPIMLASINNPNSFLHPLIEPAQDLLGSRFGGAWLVLMPVCCAVGWVSYQLVEKPALRLRRRWDAPQRTSVEQTRAAEEPQLATAIATQRGGGHR